jgi:hypothetical protein
VCAQIVVERDRDRKGLAPAPFARRAQKIRCRDDAVVPLEMADLGCEEGGAQGRNQLSPRIAGRVFDAVIDERDADSPAGSPCPPSDDVGKRQAGHPEDFRTSAAAHSCDGGANPPAQWRS